MHWMNPTYHIYQYVVYSISRVITGGGGGVAGRGQYSMHA